MTGVSDPDYFFIIGAMKAGTTSLFKYLADHPDLCPSSRKEPRIFRDPGETEIQRSALRALFPERARQRWCFEASTAYTKHPRFTGVPERLRRVVPDARLIYLVRNPVERTWSQYVHNLAHGRETRTFERALDEVPQYLDISRYHLQLTQYYKVFPRDQVLVVAFEEMVADPVETVRQICRFLDVDSSYAPPAPEVAFNASSSKLTASMPLRVLRTVGMDELVPWRVRRRLKTAGLPLPLKTNVLTPPLRALVADSVRQDTEALFESLGRRIGAWPGFA